MSISKYNAGRGLMNLGSTQMTKPVSNVLKLETLGRKRNPSAGRRARGQGLRGAPLARCRCKVIVIMVQGGEALFSLQPCSWVFTGKLLALVCILGSAATKRLWPKSLTFYF